MKRLDLTGQRFGRLIAVSIAGHRTWHCRCDCGKESVVHTSNLRAGFTKSCGCRQHHPRREGPRDKHDYNLMYSKKHAERLQIGRASYNKNNRKKIAAYRREYRKLNAEKIKAYEKLHYTRNCLRERERAKAYARHYQKTENGRAAQQRWRSKNKAHLLVLAYRYRARKLSAETDLDSRLLEDAIKSLKSVDHLPCYWCGASTTPKTRHIDHIIPLTKGGANGSANICCACARCNRRKYNKLPHEFSGQFEINFYRNSV
jgi:5-methylcytosine-specific restriction endonuclease McrA